MISNNASPRKGKDKTCNTNTKSHKHHYNTNTPRNSLKNIKHHIINNKTSKYQESNTHHRSNTKEFEGINGNLKETTKLNKANHKTCIEYTDINKTSMENDLKCKVIIKNHDTDLKINEEEDGEINHIVTRKQRQSVDKHQKNNM